MADLLIDTGNTLSVHKTPGEDKRFPNIATESIFSFGDFRIQRSNLPNTLSGDTHQASFSNFGTLNSLSNTNSEYSEIIKSDTNDLNLKSKDANSYAYFSSFYTKVASAINNVIDQFPYAMLAFDNNTGVTITNYVNNYNKTCTFSILASATTNPGNIIYASGVTVSAETLITLFNDYDQFEIELSSSTLGSNCIPIESYSYNPTLSQFNFTLSSYLFSGNTSAYTNAVFIRPSRQRFYHYKKTLSHLEKQLFFDGSFMMPNPDTDVFEVVSYEWPKSDGFNPDSSGSLFDTYTSTILLSCSQVDDIKTNWMVRTMIPENYLDLDSNGNVYRNLVSVYAEEFDKIKSYIDNIAYSHSVTYNGEESISNKFIGKFSKLLGWDQINEFNDVDIFEYFASEDADGYTVSDYNSELWKKILININWLYKKKGTRDAIMFIFKLMGAPDALINFNELVYKVQQSASALTESNSEKVNLNGYPEYKYNPYKFQEGGEGRGNGQLYLQFWEPEFQLERTIDNVKIYTGDTTLFGTENVINSKQVQFDLSPSSAIEKDVKSWYDLGFIHSNTDPNLPSYIDFSKVKISVPSAISAMTISQWMDYVYVNSIDPRNRKTVGSGHMFFYKNLKDVYLTYYYWNIANQNSNRLTFEKLNNFLTLIQRNFSSYIPKLIPATTIIESDGVTYRNTVFDRPKFVYPKGINDGSEFQIKMPVNVEPEVVAVVIRSRVNDNIRTEINTLSVSNTIVDNLNDSINTLSILSNVNQALNSTINSFKTESEFAEAYSETTYEVNIFNGVVSTFPTAGVPEVQLPSVGTIYTTKTTSGSRGESEIPAEEA